MADIGTGLKNLNAKTIAGNVFAPFNSELRDSLVSLFEMRWPGVETELSSNDKVEFHRLCKPESPDFIVDHPDYYAFFTYTVFWGYVGY